MNSMAVLRRYNRIAKERDVRSSSSKESARMEDLIVRVHFGALYRLITKSSKAIPISEIERHRGRQDKAIRDLSHAGHIFSVNPDSYYQKCFWTETLEDNLLKYSSAHTPIGEDIVVHDLLNILTYRTQSPGDCNRYIRDAGWYIIGGYYDSVGRDGIYRLADIWLNKDQYLFKGDDDLDTPVSWEECKEPASCIKRSIFKVLPKLVLRNSAEIYTNVMRKYLGSNNLTDENPYTLGITLLNINSVVPTPENIDVVKKQCQTALDAIKKYQELCSNLEQSIALPKGLGNYNKHLLIAGIQEMLRSAPILALGSEHIASDKLKGRSSEELAKYILEHAYLMSYDKLFDDRIGDWHEDRSYGIDVQNLNGYQNGIVPVKYAQEDEVLSESFRTVLNR